MSEQTILVVDYDPVFRRSLVEILSQSGYKAYGASDCRSAIRMAQEWDTSEIDLLILEMSQPDMTGVALIEALAVQQKKIIKVVASSSLFSQSVIDAQTLFAANAGIRKAATSLPAVASKWLLIVESLLQKLAEPAPILSSYIILLADDDAAVRHLVNVVLSTAGYQVLETVDGESALALARKVAAVDLVVTDVEMPRMDGLALGKAIRQENEKVPIIYMSGAEDSKFKDLNSPEEGLAFLPKPFMPKALLQLVSVMLNYTTQPAAVAS